MNFSWQGINNGMTVISVGSLLCWLSGGMKGALCIGGKRYRWKGRVIHHGKGMAVQQREWRMGSGSTMDGDFKNWHYVILWHHFWIGTWNWQYSIGNTLEISQISIVFIIELWGSPRMSCNNVMSLLGLKQDMRSQCFVPPIFIGSTNLQSRRLPTVAGNPAAINLSNTLGKPNPRCPWSPHFKQRRKTC